MWCPCRHPSRSLFEKDEGRVGGKSSANKSRLCLLGRKLLVPPYGQPADRAVGGSPLRQNKMTKALGQVNINLSTERSSKWLKKFSTAWNVYCRWGHTHASSWKDDPLFQITSQPNEITWSGDFFLLSQMSQHYTCTWMFPSEKEHSKGKDKAQHILMVVFLCCFFFTINC